ncbi:prolyl oligopeptidase family serine peptidase [Pantoea sp. AS142]|uniref:prolyl oligopeptidase family serine peptidase n=1 Tax=Pantoea sp. AS142 TaxID=3081292 RepID=UPI00301873AD
MTHSAHQDFLLKLESPQNAAALKWVEKQNQRIRERFTGDEQFRQIQKTILLSLNDKSNIPWGEHYHDRVYNFWQDEYHPRGIWRRTPEADYLTEEPEWETVLDIDRLNEQEGIKWHFQRAKLLYPAFTRALIFLSQGGDACEIREFDLISKTFIQPGFFLAESKSAVDWLDEDTLLLALDAGGDTLTASGYPRCVSRWRRGTEPDESERLYRGQMSDMMVAAWHDHRPGFERTVIECCTDFYRSHTYLLTEAGTLEYIDIPDDASCGFFNEWLLVTLVSCWQIADQRYPAGALLAVRLADFQQGQRNFTLLFTPDEHTMLQDYSPTKNYLLLNLIRDVVNEVEIAGVHNGQWHRVKTVKLPDFTTLSAYALNNVSDRYLTISCGFLQPYSLSYGDISDHSLHIAKQAPACFDAREFGVTQHFALSADGIPIPYFQIAVKGLELTGDHPTLLYGYGGFEVSLTPEYIGPKGVTWLQRGGVYVVANIRGGGEYGPAWHQAALKQHRHRAYEDFAAIAADLITRKVTSAARLAAQGGSNGGLLIGNMLTDYPELFGALVCEVPLLDMTNYHRWLAGASWIAEYGDPEIAEERQWLTKYSPYDNVAADKYYPPVLFTTGTRDDRVSPAHARKMVAKMQHQGHSNVWLYEETDAGHGNAPENSQKAFYSALIEAFLWQMLKKH